jgi:hypothetical protein
MPLSKTTSNSKNILTSKTFWLNVLGIAVSLTGFIPEQYSLPVLGVLNIIIRLMTDKPAHVIPEAMADGA